MEEADAPKEILIMAMTRMRSGICTAGLVADAEAAGGMAWVRPVKPYGSLLLGDMTDAAGRVVQVGEVVELALVRPRPNPVHREDWVTDFIRRRPRVVGRLAGARWAEFLDQHIDPAPDDVLVHHRRSLCLVQPIVLSATFLLDLHTGKYEARVTFTLAGCGESERRAPLNLPVTDLAWRALGRRWLAEQLVESAPAEEVLRLMLEDAELRKRLSATTIFLSIGLSRTYEGKIWPLVIGVHPLPAYAVTIDYAQL